MFSTQLELFAVHYSSVAFALGFIFLKSIPAAHTSKGQLIFCSQVLGTYDEF
jgi:hypothetical protein